MLKPSEKVVTRGIKIPVLSTTAVPLEVKLLFYVKLDFLYPLEV